MVASSGFNTKLITNKSRSAFEICLKLTIKTSKKKSQQQKNKQRHVYSTPKTLEQSLRVATNC